ncbi:PQ-loop-domain-containing protein [Peniophora sp. CONT]|nr:PQ-loop-domain-containing protein [Peniophora sp. CONT]
MLSAAETASSVLGWISIATWILVYTPQLIENYKRKSGDGVSVPFVVIWLAGDILNLLGALIANLLPTVILLAVWYSLCDSVLLGQIYYYRWRQAHTAAMFADDDAPVPADESAPLLAGGNEVVEETEKQTSSLRRELLQYTGSIVFVVAVGVAAWAVSTKMDTGDDVPPTKGAEEVIEWRSQVMGWISAVLYLGSRVPQILKNTSTRCEGLSPGMFVFTILANATYTASILVVGLDRQHLIVNASWLAGSALTIFLDLFVLGQFVHYRSEARVTDADGAA